jgi:uncharacterized protein YjiS (DUF1127 family)
MSTSFAVAHRPASTTAAVTGQVASSIAAIFARMAAMYMRRRTMRALLAMNDRELRDIGLSRGEIGTIEQHPRYSPRFRRT